MRRGTGDMCSLQFTVPVERKYVQFYMEAVGLLTNPVLEGIKGSVLSVV
jgi:hypothetical protein